MSKIQPGIFIAVLSNRSSQAKCSCGIDQLVSSYAASSESAVSAIFLDASS